MKSDSLWKTCEDCGKQFSVKAKSCPQCGKGGRRFSRLKWFGGGFAALVIATAIFGSDEAEKGVLVGNSTPSASASAVKSTAAPLPERQTSFIAAVSDYKTRFESAVNELQQSVLRDERSAAILRAVGNELHAEGW